MIRNSAIACDGLPGRGPDAYGIRRDPEPCVRRGNPERFTNRLCVPVGRTIMKTSVRFPSREEPSGLRTVSASAGRRSFDGISGVGANAIFALASHGSPWSHGECASGIYSSAHTSRASCVTVVKPYMGTGRLELCSFLSGTRIRRNCLQFRNGACVDSQANLRGYCQRGMPSLVFISPFDTNKQKIS